MEHPLAPVFRAISATRGDPSLVCAYGVVLYTARDLELRKLLDDTKVIDALDALSGARWVLFLGQLKPGARQSTQASRSLRDQLDDILNPTTGLAKAFQMPDFGWESWSEPNENTVPLKALGLQTSESLPCLLLLFPHAEEEAYALRVSLPSTSAEATRERLFAQVQSVTEALDGIAPENFKNPEGVREAVAMRLTNDRHRALLVKAQPFLTWAAKKLRSALGS